MSTPADIQGLRDQVQALNRELEVTKVSMREIEMLFFSYFALARRAGLPDNAGQLLLEVRRIITALRMARIAYQLFTAESLGPVGWLLGLARIGTAGLILTDTFNFMGPSY